MAPLHVDTIIDAGWIIPVTPDEKTVLKNHSIIITASKISHILPTSHVTSNFIPVQRLDRRTHVVMPGLINAHTHTGMTIMRGRADDQPLLKWLRETIWPLEEAYACKEEFCNDGALLAAAEMIRGGITCFSDMYFYPAQCAQVAVTTGLRAIIGIVLIKYPSRYACTPDDYLERGDQVRKQFSNHPNIHFTFAPHAPYSVSTESWIRLKKLSEQYDIPIHTHLHETKEECSASLLLDRSNPACHTSNQHCHPIQDFHEKGLLSSRLAAAHMVHLSDHEIALCAKYHVNILHCPTSNAKLASGFCPVHKLLDANVNVALGTDSACSNNTLDLFAEMKMAALTAKNVAGDATVLPAATAIRMATINGARAFGIHHVTGSLEVGKSADLICIHINTHAANTPVYDVHSAVVYASSRHDVNDVMVAGNFILKEKKYCTLDLSHVLRKTEYWANSIVKQFPLK